MTRMLSAAELAQRLGLSKPRVKQLLRAGRVPGAVQLGDTLNAPWIIPEDFTVTAAAHGPKPKYTR